MARVWRRLMVTLSWVALTACRGFVEPSPGLIEKLRAAEEAAAPPYLREKVVAKIVSPWMSGEFDGVILARTGDSPRVRLQLYPDVGGKILDLSASRDRITGYLPQARQGSDHALPLRGRPDVILVLGILLLEHYSGRWADRASGMRESDEGWEVRLRPVARALDVFVFVGRDGRVQRRRYEWGCCAEWEQMLDGIVGFTVDVGDGSLSIRKTGSNPLPSVAENLFELKLPADCAPLDR